MDTARARSLKVDLNQNSVDRVEDDVALETPITIRTNNRPLVAIFATPSLLKEMAVGYVIGEGIARGLEDLLDVKVDGTNVDLTLSKRSEKRARSAKAFKVLASACGSTEDFYRILDQMDKPMVKSDYRIRADDLSSLVRELNMMSSSLRNVAVHTAAICTDGEFSAYAIDVGRHNAVDKVIGIGSLKGIDFHRSLLLTTGRQPSDMVLKAARAGIPISATIRGPIYSGIFAAWKTNVTMVANARGPHMRIYTHPERIILPWSEQPQSPALEEPAGH